MIHSVSWEASVENMVDVWEYFSRLEAEVFLRDAFFCQLGIKRTWRLPSLYFLRYELTLFTALFTNMRILKFKSQLTIAFFAAVNHLNGLLRKQNFTLTGSKGHGLWFVIGGFRYVLCVSALQGSLLVIVIMIDGSEKRNCEGGFWTSEFACLWKAQ